MVRIFSLLNNGTILRRNIKNTVGDYTVTTMYYSAQFSSYESGCWYTFVSVKPEIWIFSTLSIHEFIADFKHLVLLELLADWEQYHNNHPKYSRWDYLYDYLNVHVCDLMM